MDLLDTTLLERGSDVPRLGILERLLKGISTGVRNSRLLVQLFVYYHFLGKLNNIDSLGASPSPHHFSNSQVQAICRIIATLSLPPFLRPH